MPADTEAYTNKSYDIATSTNEAYMYVGADVPTSTNPAHQVDTCQSASGGLTYDYDHQPTWYTIS